MFSCQSHPKEEWKVKFKKIEVFCKYENLYFQPYIYWDGDCPLSKRSCLRRSEFLQHNPKIPFGLPSVYDIPAGVLRVTKRVTVKVPTAKQYPLQKPIQLLWHCSVARHLPALRYSLCLCTDGYPTALTPLWFWRCHLAGIVTCRFGWRWRRSWGWSGGWWCLWKADCLLCSPSQSGWRGDSGFLIQGSGAWKSSGWLQAHQINIRLLNKQEFVLTGGSVRTLVSPWWMKRYFSACKTQNVKMQINRSLTSVDILCLGYPGVTVC